MVNPSFVGDPRHERKFLPTLFKLSRIREGVSDLLTSSLPLVLLIFSSCQIASSDPDKLNRLRNDSDFPTVTLLSQTEIIRGGDQLSLDYRAEGRFSPIENVELYYAN
ncbi:MAG: hypothetical protein EOP09_03790, partial [Proteobacteria bacterium]